MAMMNIPAIRAAINSAKTADSHMPSISHSVGSKKINATWNITVLTKDSIAEIRPLLRAVKRAEPKIAIPQNKKDMEYSLKAWAVNCKSC